VNPKSEDNIVFKPFSSVTKEKDKLAQKTNLQKNKEGLIFSRMLVQLLFHTLSDNQKKKKRDFFAKLWPFRSV
jgi:hypothetical protein